MHGDEYVCSRDVLGFTQVHTLADIQFLLQVTCSSEKTRHEVSRAERYCCRLALDHHLAPWTLSLSGRIVLPTDGALVSRHPLHYSSHGDEHSSCLDSHCIHPLLTAYTLTDSPASKLTMHLSKLWGFFSDLRVAVSIAFLPTLRAIYQKPSLALKPQEVSRLFMSFVWDEFGPGVDGSSKA